MGFYQQKQATVDRMLKAYGQVVTMRRVVKAFNAATGVSTPTNTDFPANGCVFEYAQREIDGTDILEGDMQLYLSPLQTSGAASYLPLPSDIAVIQGVIWKVVRSKNLNPAGIDVMYECQIRK